MIGKLEFRSERAGDLFVCWGCRSYLADVKKNKILTRFAFVFREGYQSSNKSFL